jgi:hypothetical protein
MSIVYYKALSLKAQGVPLHTALKIIAKGLTHVTVK